MTQREYAVDLINALSDEQVKTLISFITGFSDSDIVDRIKKTQLAVSETKSKQQSLGRLRQMIRSVKIDNEKELLSEYREEKYGFSNNAN